MSNFLIKNKSERPLVLNESFDQQGKKKYIFEGPFTIINGDTGKKNRNGRLYDKDEVLKHVSYLRDRIRKEGSILGALDHPDGYFEIRLKEVSHKIIDLWYDERQNVVMGKLELLDTPNGQIAKTLVEAGYPLFVSSRAAGTVGNDSHVHIQQMFTYDIVATPGFEEAKLHQVSESFAPEVRSFLNESISSEKSKNNIASKFSIEDPNITIQEMSEAAKIDMKEIKSINEEEVKQPLTAATETPEQIDGTDGAAQLGIPTAETGLVEETEEGDEKPANSENSSSNEEDADLIVDIVPQFASDIVEIEPVFAGEEEEESSEEEPKEEEEESEDKEEEKKEEEPKEEKAEVEETEKKEEYTLTNAESLKKRNEETLNKYDNIIKELKTKKSVKESIIDRYPFAISLSESNFAKFSALLDDDKNKVASFIYENGIMDIVTINESWEIPLKARVINSKKWMSLASAEDIALFNEAPKEVQESITESAKFFDIRTKADVEEFWANTGLRQAKARKIMNESFVENYKEMFNPINEENELPYTQEFIDAIGNMM